MKIKIKQNNSGITPGDIYDALFQSGNNCYIIIYSGYAFNVQAHEAEVVSEEKDQSGVIVNTSLRDILGEKLKHINIEFK